jgi:hypothetical protein
MNRQLKRIEQTLQKLEKTTTVSTATATLPQPAPANNYPKAQASVSFEVVRRTVDPAEANPDRATIEQPEPVASAAPSIESLAQTSAKPPVKPLIMEPSPDEGSNPNKFDLPNFAKPSPGNLGFSSHQNGNNPDIALNLLRDALNMVEAWRNELTQVGLQIQKLYLEGPIVDGWLECSTQKVENTTQVLRHAEVNQLMDYVDQLCQDPSKTHPEYRLCGLSAEGKTWSSPCPPEQIASLSLAISRHQKLKPLLLRKVELEKKLAHVAEEVVKLHSRI